MTIEIDDDRALAAALADCPVVDADPDGSRRIGHRMQVTSRSTVRAACRHVEVREETRAACTAAGEADPGLRLAKPPRTPGRACARRVMGVSAKVRRRQAGLRQ